MIIAAISLLLYIALTRRRLVMGWKEILGYSATGLLVAGHWVLFYHCIKISTIPVALVSLSSITLFTSLLQPLVNRQRVVLLDLVTGLIIISGIVCIFHFEAKYVVGTLTGIAAAAVASLFTVINSRFSQSADPIVVSFYEMLGGFGGLSVIVAFYGVYTRAGLSLSTSDLLYLLLLGTVCTGLAYAVAISVMKTLSPVTVVLVTSLEPVYGILLSFLFFGHKQAMTSGFYLGAAIILLAVLSYPLIRNNAWQRKNYQL